MKSAVAPSSSVPNRKSLRLHGYDYSLPGVYFVTICAYRHERLFGTILDARMIQNAIGDVIERTWKNLPRRFPAIALDAYMVMPDHVHGIVIFSNPNFACEEGTASRAPARDGGGRQVPASAIAAQTDDARAIATSRVASRRHVTLGTVVHAFKAESSFRLKAILNRPGQALWQRSYFDHIIRTGEALDDIRRYIWDNPLRWQLKSSAHI